MYELRGCSSRLETCTSSNQAKSQHGEVRVNTKFHPLIRSYLQLIPIQTLDNVYYKIIIKNTVLKDAKRRNCTHGRARVKTDYTSLPRNEMFELNFDKFKVSKLISHIRQKGEE